MPSFLFNNGTFFPDGGITPQAAVPVAGATVIMSGPSLSLTPAGTLATLTIRLPSNPKPGMVATIISSTAVTALTLLTATGAAVTGAPTALVANTQVRMQYMGSVTGWVWVH
jgi:hypothetical protein